MKTKPLSRFIIALPLLLCLGASVQAAIPPVWPPPPPCTDPPFCPYFPAYQGYLTDRGIPADGLYHIITRIYDAPTGGHLLGPPTTNQSVQVQNGLFTIYLKVPPGLSGLPPIDGDNTWWLEHCIQHPEDPICQVIEPRQRVSPAVQSLYANLAASVKDGAVSASKLAPGAVGNVALGEGAVTASKMAPGAVENLGLADGSITAAKIAPGHVVRSLNGMTDAITLSAGAGLMLAPTNNGLALHVARACDDYDDWYWTLLGNAGTADAFNFLGTTDPVPLNLRVNNLRVMRYEYPVGSPSPNLIGGYGGNLVSDVGGTIGGGGRLTGINKVLGPYGTVSGGYTNVIEFANNGVIGGGAGNTIRNNVELGTIGGGGGNSVDGISYWPTIGGGQVNHIEGFTEANTIGGGEANTIKGGTSYSTIGGGGIHTLAAASATISGGIRNSIQFSALGSTVGGGENNLIVTNAWYSMIGGGISNIIGTIGTGATIGGGATNSALNAFAAVGGGYRNRASGRVATIAGGENNSVSANYGAVGGGAVNVVTADYATVPGGTRGVASHYGEVVHANGAFANNGDAQAAHFVLRTNTSPAAPQGELFLDGLNRRMTVPVGSSWAFDVLIVGRSTAGTSAGFQIRGVVENDGATTTLLLAPVAPPLKVTLGEDVAGWDANVEADNFNDALVIKVVGDTQSTIRWVAHVRTAQVSNP